MAALPLLHSSGARNSCGLVAVDNYSRLLFNTSRPGPSEYCMCEVTATRNVQKHVYAMMFVCPNRLRDQWVEVAGDLSTLIRNLWSAKMFGLRGGRIGSCRTCRQAGDRRGEST